MIVAYYLTKFLWWLRSIRTPKVRTVPVDHSPHYIRQHDEHTRLIDYAWANVDTYQKERP